MEARLLLHDQERSCPAWCRCGSRTITCVESPAHVRIPPNASVQTARGAPAADTLTCINCCDVTCAADYCALRIDPAPCLEAAPTAVCRRVIADGLVVAAPPSRLEIGCRLGQLPHMRRLLIPATADVSVASTMYWQTRLRLCCFLPQVRLWRLGGAQQGLHRSSVSNLLTDRLDTSGQVLDSLCICTQLKTCLTRTPATAKTSRTR